VSLAAVTGGSTAKNDEPVHPGVRWVALRKIAYRQREGNRRNADVTWLDGAIVARGTGSALHNARQHRAESP
jgi:hypothetical protein